MASGGPVFGLREGPSTSLSCCLFLAALVGLPVLFILQLKPFFSSDCLFEGSQSSGGLFGCTQSTDFCLDTFLGL